MSTEPQRVPLQTLHNWGGAASAVLGAHLGATDYLLASAKPKLQVPSKVYTQNGDIWRDIIQQQVDAGTEIVLQAFQVMPWFPRAPGLYYTPQAEYARQEAFNYLHDGFPSSSPIRDHAHYWVAQKERSADYTVVFTPQGKLSMLEGGIGSVRLKPIHAFGEPHWLMTASSDGVTHSGVPIALPRTLYAPLVGEIARHGASCATLKGELEFVPNPFSRLFDRSVMVPRLLLRVTELQPCAPTNVTLETSVAVSFVSEYQGQPNVYVTYVTFRPDVAGSFKEAAQWMKTEYVEGEYRGRIITDFDQTKTIFPEARLALSKVMGRLITRGELEETIELMHVTASVDDYFKEIAVRELLPGKQRSQRNKIFISYAHAPEKETGWVDRINKHLKGLAMSSDFEVWDDRRIDPGRRWHEEIKQAIGRTRVAILVLTADFLASDYIRDAELPLLLEAADAEGATIFCVYGSDVHLSGVAERLSQYQFVNDPERPLLALTPTQRESVYKKLTGEVEKVLKPGPP